MPCRSWGSARKRWPPTSKPCGPTARPLRRRPRSIEFRQSLNDCYRDLAGLQGELNQAGQAAATSLERRKLWSGNATELYHIAHDLALCTSLVGSGKTALSAKEDAERHSYADHVDPVLREAIASGYKDTRQLDHDPGFDGLRSRDDFKQLRSLLEEKARPGSK